jgi:hypothetical protein
MEQARRSDGFNRLAMAPIRFQEAKSPLETGAMSAAMG